MFSLCGCGTHFSFHVCVYMRLHLHTLNIYDILVPHTSRKLTLDLGERLALQCLFCDVQNVGKIPETINLKEGMARPGIGDSHL